jgi:glycerol-3-phosphate acyltransferase PlsY
MSDVPVVLAAAIVGYLVGSISSARLLARWAAPGHDLRRTEWPIDEKGVLVSLGVSPSGLGVRAGRRWGCLAALLDIGKTFAVTLLFGLLAPADGTPLPAAVAGGAAMVGHVFPLYHGFVGGFGQSPIVGATLALDWVALPVATVTGWLSGFLVGDALLAYEGWPLFLVPFAAWRGDMVLLGWAIFVNTVYWVRMWPEARQRIAHQRATGRSWRERVGEILRGYP